MNKRLLASLLLSIAVVIAVCERHSVAIAGAFDWSTYAVANTNVPDANPDGDNSTGTEGKRGNSFVRALSAPFRALGKLFGGRKKQEQVARKITQKDIAKFETTTVTRVTDARVQVPTTPTTSTNSAPAPSPVDTHVELGRQKLAAGDLNGAIAELTQANDQSAEVQNLLGVAFEGKGLRDRALESFKRAVKLEKKNPQYLNNYGFLLFKNNEFEAATKYLKQAAKLAPSDARVWNNLGFVQCERGKFDDAFESFVKAVGEYDGHLNMAAQLLKHGYGKDAIVHLEHAQALRPESTEVLTKLVGMYSMTGRLTDAENARRVLNALQSTADADNKKRADTKKN